MRITSTLVAVALACAAIPAAAQQQITGAGSTFAAPIYGKWNELGKATVGAELNYQAIGSGAGINQINNRTVDFGASDMPVAADQLKEHKLMQFPAAIGGVVIVVNIPGVEANQLKLTGPVLAEIYLGKITKWDAKEIAAINPDVKLPSVAIAPVHRADGSGTTFVLADYLSMMSPEWKSQVGASTSVKWPTGAGAKGNDGVSGTVHNIRGGIGYVESAYASQNHLVTAQMQNKDCKWVKPDEASFSAAAASADWGGVQNFAVDLNNEPGDNSWPIESATFVLLPTDPADAEKSAAVMKFFDWGFKNGDDAAKGLQYIVLPAAVKDAVRKAWSTDVQANGKPIYNASR
jgi:phosphate transport system substrate-binding protein